MKLQSSNTLLIFNFFEISFVGHFEFYKPRATNKARFSQGRIMVITSKGFINTIFIEGT